MIAWFGTGLLGANFVRALLRRGEAVQVWNRTAAKAQALAGEGARICADPAEAARGAERIHLTLSDDASVDAVLEAARFGLAPGAAIIDHTTTSPAGAAARAWRWVELGHPFQNAPVFMGPPNALNSTGTILASGDRALFDRLEPSLAPMTRQVVYLGAEPGRAAVFKLMGNLFILAMGAGLADMAKLARANGVSAAEAGAMFEWFVAPRDPGPRWARMTTADLSEPFWKLAMARKDAGLMMDAAAGGPELALVPAIAAILDHWIAAGRAKHDWLVIGEEGLEPRE